MNRFMPTLTLLLVTASLTLSTVGYAALLEEVANSRWQWTGIAVTDDHQIFVNYPRWSDRMKYSVARLDANGRPQPFPSVTWNDWQPGQPVKADQFVAVQSVVRDAVNTIWVLDTGNPYFRGVISGAARLFSFDAKSGRLLRTYGFTAPALKDYSYLNDVRIDLEHGSAYITDSGAGGLVVLNLETGHGRRVLDGHPATMAENIDVVIKGLKWHPGGERPQVHSDGIAYDAARDRLYFQVLTGRSLYEVPANLLRDEYLDGSVLADQVKKVATTFHVDGLLVDGQSRLYLSNLEAGAIDRLTRDGNQNTITRLVESRLISWPDSFSLTANGWLYLATSQIHRGDNPDEPYRIVRLPVEAVAGEMPTPNAVKAFVYRWFSGFDHQSATHVFLHHLPESQVDMCFPDFPIKSRADFERWYAGVRESIAWNRHGISNLAVTANEDGSFAVSLDIHWQARTYSEEAFDMKIHQDWTVTVGHSGRFVITRHRARVAKSDQKGSIIMNSDLAQKNKEKVRAFFSALEAEDVDKVVALFAEDALHINPYHSGIFPEGAQGKEGIRAYWAPVFPNFDGMQFPIHEIYAMEDPNIVFVRYGGRIKLKNNAGLYENDYYSTFKFNDKGEIREYVEIFNPIIAARGFGLLNKIK